MTAPEPTLAVQARDLHVSLGGTPILHDISFDVPAGQTLAIMGGNGSGKSTLVRTLLGVIKPTKGSVHVAGRPLGRTVDWHTIGYVPQRVTASGGVSASALEVVRSGLLHGWRIIPPSDAKSRALEALDLMGIATRAHDPVGSLSGGQQQRVLIARALARTPSIVFLDEPVAGVDLASQAAFADALLAMKTQGATVLIVLHEIGHFASLIDRAIVLEHGCKVHDGEPPHAHGVHALPGHDHVHPHTDPLPDEGEPVPRDFRITHD